MSRKLRIYRHYKGGLYLYEGVILPLTEDQRRYIKDNDIAAYKFIDVATKDNTEEVASIYKIDGGLFLDKDSSYIQYIAMKEVGMDPKFDAPHFGFGGRWIREANHFYENVIVDGESKRRFQYVGDQIEVEIN